MMEMRKISDIKIGEWHRKDMGDIGGLAASIESIGLLHPVVINRDDELIAGERRIRAFEALGRTDIPVTVVDIESAEIVLGEDAENEQRKGFTVSERVAIGKEVEKALGDRRGRRTQQAADECQVIGTLEHTDKLAAKKAGFGNPETYRQAKAVVAAAEAEPEKFGALAEEMDITGKVQGAHKRLKESKRTAAHIKATDRTAKKKTQPTPDVSGKADAADPAKLIVDAIEQLESINVGTAVMARISNDQRVELMVQLARANARLNKTAIDIAISGGANLGVLSHPSLRYEALTFMRNAIDRIEATLTDRDVQESAS